MLVQVSEHEAIIGNDVSDRVPVSLVTHVGDLSYGCGNGFVWEQWGLLIEPVAASVPYMVAVGNHEYVHEENCTSHDGVDISGVKVLYCIVLYCIVLYCIVLHCIVLYLGIVVYCIVL